MNKQKRSKQRDAILKVLQSTKCHPTADWVYEEVRKEIPNISLGTVYRNLAKLSEEQTILKLGIGTTTEHFDGNPNPHYHVLCVDCGRIDDIDAPPLNELNSWAEERYQGKIYKHSAIFFGKCSECNK